MKIKWLWFSMLAAAGVVLLAGGLLVPAYLRAVDASVIQRAGWKGPTLLERGRTLAEKRQLGAALMVAEAARLAGISGWDRLGETITNLERPSPGAVAWGGDTQLENLFANAPNSPVPFTAFIIRPENRERALAHLQDLPLSDVQSVLRCRELKNTVLFPPSASAAGQALDAAVAECGLLLEGGNLTAGLSDSIAALATAANRGRGSAPLEQVLMDLMSLGERLDWNQLTAFVAQIPDAGTLHQLAEQARSAGEQLPVLFAAVQLSGQPAAVAHYLVKFKQTGLADLAASLDSGAGGVNELLRSDRRIYRSDLVRRVMTVKPLGDLRRFAADYSFQQPWLALAAKWLAYLLGGFFLAAAAHAARPAVSPLERPLRVRGFHVFREFLFSLGFLFVVLLLSEPFLAQENQKGNFPFQLHLPTVGGAATGGIASLTPIVMNPIILLTLLLFFVLQSLIYLACLLKLAEIRRQAVPPRMKLKLLENEDHLFDAGLYLGFVGTIVSLIIASLGLVKFSLMAAYSSTSFGIIFVCIFKIFHLRPARRKLLLEADAADAYAAVAPGTAAVPQPLPS